MLIAKISAANLALGCPGRLNATTSARSNTIRRATSAATIAGFHVRQLAPFFAVLRQICS
jgi:hypothetical protein